MKRNQEKGITLIALVITIIVLLILAGISIATLTGKNGILTQAEEAKTENRGGTVEEKVNLWKSEKFSNNITNTIVVKTEEEMLQELLDDNLVISEEINRENKTITIGNRVIDYATEQEPESSDVEFYIHWDRNIYINTEAQINQTIINKPGKYEFEGDITLHFGDYLLVGGSNGNNYLGLVETTTGTQVEFDEPVYIYKNNEKIDITDYIDEYNKISSNGLVSDGIIDALKYYKVTTVKNGKTIMSYVFYEPN